MQNEERINGLETQVRTLKRLVYGFGCLLVAGVVVGATSLQRVPNEIQAKQFEVVNDEGKKIVIIGKRDDGGGGGLATFDSKGNVTFSTITVANVASPLMPRSVTASSQNHWVKKNYERGKMIELEDGTLWEVYGLDRLNCSLWLPLTDIVIIENSSNPQYPYKLVGEGEVVQVKLVGKK